MIPVSTPETGGLGSTSSIDRTAHLANLLHLRRDLDSTVATLSDIRDRATAHIQELTIPSPREEEWRFTDLSPLLQANLQPAAHPLPEREAIAPFLLPEAANTRLVFVNGVYAPELSAVSDLPVGVVIAPLSAVNDLPTLSYLTTLPGAEEVFTTLNTASFTDAAVVVVPKNQVVTAPIQVLSVTVGEAAAIVHPRCLVVAAAGSSLTLVEDFVALRQGEYFTNPVTEIWIEANAEVNHTRVQRDHGAAIHVGKTAVSVMRDARYTCNAISLGAVLSRHNLEVHQMGEQTSITLNGLTVIGGNQLADTHSTIAYTKPHGTSKQVHKCIVSDRAHAVFNGKIVVPKAAQLTDAAQLSRTLLLSPKSRVDTKPQLEITADNVKCAHGATVSQLEDDEVFYLQSRGIPHDAARQLLTYAFAIDLVDHIPVPSLHTTLTSLLRSQPF